MKKHITVVDDKESIAKIIFSYLKSDYTFNYFDTPIKAIKWFNEGNSADLIISDIRMPEMRGDEFLAYLKGNLILKDIPVIILSAEDSSTARIQLLENGAADYIVKPFNPLELKIRIKKVIG